MIERTTRQLVEDLNQATQKLTEMSQEKKGVSQQEVKDLIRVLHHFNETYASKFDSEKKFVPVEMQASIEKALGALQLFQRFQPNQKNIQQAIISLSSALSKAMNTFDKNLRDLKKYRIGYKVEKTTGSKQSSP